MVYRREDLFQRFIDVLGLRTIKHRTTTFAFINQTFIEGRSSQIGRNKSTHAARTSTLVSEFFFVLEKKNELEIPPLPLPRTNTIENNPITVSKNLTKQTNSTEDKFQPRKVDGLRVAQWIFSTCQPFSIKYPNDRVRNDPPTSVFF